jgi:protein-S-isoprenylcysteine O-methyltransferase Ste14
VSLLHPLDAICDGKLWLEEQWMHAEFGESHEAYCRKVAALVPYIL